MQKVRNHKFVDSVSDERNSDSGIWVYLKNGYHTGEYEGYYDRLHQIHEDTWSECLRALRYVKPCDCEDCKQYGVS